MLVSHLGAAVAAADRLLHLIYRGFSCIDFSNPSHIHYPYTGLEWELRKCLPRARPPSPPLGAGYPHRDYGDGARVMTRPTMMTAKHGVGVFPSCCLSKGFHAMRASRMASVFDRLFVFSLDRRLTYQHAARTREGHRRTQVSSRRWLVYEMMVVWRRRKVQASAFKEALPGSGVGMHFRRPRPFYVHFSSLFFRAAYFEWFIHSIFGARQD